MRRTTLVLVVAFLVITLLPGSASAAPTNDDFDDAHVITGSSGSLFVGSTAGATRELDEPFHAGETKGETVWFQWVAPANTGVMFDTLETTGEHFMDAGGAVIAVYVGT